MLDIAAIVRGGANKTSKRGFVRLKAFTLAEVLITLTIIGIVASMTIPLVSANHKKIEYPAKLKKVYNLLNEAVEQAETDYNLPIYKWPKKSTGKEFFETYLKDYIKYSKTVDGNDIYGYGDYCDWYGKNSIGVYLDDGIVMSFNGDAFIKFDINGEKGPNQDGRDMFQFEINYGGNASSDNPSILKDLPGYTDTSRSQYLATCKKGSCYANACTALIMNDGWEIKDDYPFKL